ncbi:MAG: heavy metal translocating P-type ATPase [Putridiphycobacter sp.]
MKECYHCGSNCDEEIHFDSKVFCCEGCKTVYDILSGNDLSNYYNIEQTVGELNKDKVGVKANKSFKGKYNFLDLPEFRNKLITFSEGDYSKIKLFLPQIHCSSCLWLLERLDKLAEGVTASQVFFAKKEAEITFNESKISLRALAELLASIGYPPSITLEDYDKAKTSKSNKQLIFKIGLVGFCFGNVMLMSFPEYFGIDQKYLEFQHTFNYINLGLSIPVLVYGAKDYIVSAYKSLKNKRINIDVPITMGIFALYFRSLYEVIFTVGAGYFDSFIGLIFFLLIGKWFQNQTYSAINFERDYKSYFPIAVSKLNPNGEEEIVALRKINVSDKLLIRNNELIPTDSILLRGKGSIDYSFVTGESVPIEKKSGDKLYAGGKQKGETIEVEVIKKIENSYLTQLWNNPIFDKKSETETLSDKISRNFTIAIIIVALLAGAYWLFKDPGQASFVMVSVLIVACPCAIALSVPFTFGNGIRVLGRKGFYLRSVNVIEPLTKITDLVFDKTGTITHNNQSKIVWEGETLTDIQLNIIQQATFNSSHPLSRQISSYLSKGEDLKFENFSEIPSKGIEVKINQDTWKIGHKDWIGATAKDNKTRVYIACNQTILGAYVFENIYRLGLPEMFKAFENQFNIHILSGDNDSEKEKLKELLPEHSALNFNQKPEDKLKYIEALQQEGKQVMMFGDGLNDAGALQQADVGVSVVDDVYSFTPSSDAIINGDKLTQIPNYLNFSKFNVKVVKWSYVFSLIYNLIGLSFAITGHLKPLVAAVLMPLSSISVVVLVTVATSLRGRRLK